MCNYHIRTSQARYAAAHWHEQSWFVDNFWSKVDRQLCGYLWLFTLAAAVVVVLVVEWQPQPRHANIRNNFRRSYLASILRQHTSWASFMHCSICCRSTRIICRWSIRDDIWYPSLIDKLSAGADETVHRGVFHLSHACDTCDEARYGHWPATWQNLAHRRHSVIYLSERKETETRDKICQPSRWYRESACAVDRLDTVLSNRKNFVCLLRALALAPTTP